MKLNIALGIFPEAHYAFWLNFKYFNVWSICLSLLLYINRLKFKNVFTKSMTCCNNCNHIISYCCCGPILYTSSNHSFFFRFYDIIFNYGIWLVNFYFYSYGRKCLLEIKNIQHIERKVKIFNCLRFVER